VPEIHKKQIKFQQDFFSQMNLNKALPGRGRRKGKPFTFVGLIHEMISGWVVPFVQKGGLAQQRVILANDLAGANYGDSDLSKCLVTVKTRNSFQPTKYSCDNDVDAPVGDARTRLDFEKLAVSRGKPGHGLYYLNNRFPFRPVKQTIKYDPYARTSPRVRKN
jgi:hypothetical protein